MKTKINDFALDPRNLRTNIPKWERIVAEAKKREANGGEILTAAEEREWVRAYNNTYNEGGEGYVPTRITTEQVEEAKCYLALVAEHNLTPAGEEEYDIGEKPAYAILQKVETANFTRAVNVYGKVFLDPEGRGRTQRANHTAYCSTRNGLWDTSRPRSRRRRIRI